MSEIILPHFPLVLAVVLGIGVLVLRRTDLIEDARRLRRAEETTDA